MLQTLDNIHLYIILRTSGKYAKNMYITSIDSEIDFVVQLHWA